MDDFFRGQLVLCGGAGTTHEVPSGSLLRLLREADERILS